MTCSLLQSNMFRKKTLIMFPSSDYPPPPFSAWQHHPPRRSGWNSRTLAASLPLKPCVWSLSLWGTICPHPSTILFSPGLTSRDLLPGQVQQQVEKLSSSFHCCLPQFIPTQQPESAPKKKKNLGTGLVVQWLRICLAMQGSRGAKTPHAMEQLRLRATTRVHAPHERSHVMQLRPNAAK